MRNQGPNLHVYVIGPAREGPVKIGHAVDPLKRLSGLQVGNHLELKLWSAWASDKLSKRQVEKRVHVVLRYARIRGEWFNVTVEEAEEVLRKLDDGKRFELSEDLIKTLERAMTCHPRWNTQQVAE